jgi:hypothetical protein
MSREWEIYSDRKNAQRREISLLNIWIRESGSVCAGRPIVEMGDYHF